MCNDVFFDYGLCMVSVACMLLAFVFGVQFAIALLLMFKSKNMQERIRLFVCSRGVSLLNMDCICFV